jgi:aarF domain-containing kinase
MRACLRLRQSYLRFGTYSPSRNLFCRHNVRAFHHENSASARLFTIARTFFRKPPRPSGQKIFLFAALSPAAFISISEQDQHDGKTGEEHMLEASREEIKNALPDRISHANRIVQRVYYVIDTCLIEPACTGLRFLHLVFIFVPVLATVPMIWVGRRRKDGDGERSGTLWWYGFLVASMERAGAAFIKVQDLPRVSTAQG